MSEMTRIAPRLYGAGTLRWSRLLLAPFATALLAVPAPAQPAPTAIPAADPAATLRAIEARGRLLFDLDRAGWVATDDFLRKVRDPAAAGFQGYVVEPEDSGFAVTFYGGDPLAAMYVAKVAGGRVTSSQLLADPDRRPLTPLQLRLAAARSGAAAHAAGKRMNPCTRAPFNVAIIPPASLDGPVEAYLTSPQTDADTYPFGGHFLLTMAPDGTIASERKFTNACLNMEKPRASRRRGAPAALMVAHLLDPVPTEIHVFQSIAIGLPVIVLAGDPPQIWMVEKGTILPMGRLDAATRRGASD